ncbi:MAG: sigma-54 dependent transcriptional regulator [Deltaproteobacteria bacterium]|nr:sigma-54 dependent transcriptional regulator [Deltaproteobacteria bacterium]
MEKENAKILVVDDEKHFCTILSTLLKKEGFRVLTAMDGETALRTLRVESPDVMLTDLKMPGMNGIELLKKAKELDPDLPVVMVTAFADIPGAVNAIKVGAHDYLGKPFDNYEAIRVVQRALAERRLKRNLSDLSSRLQENITLREVMGPSDVVARVISEANRVAQSDFAVVVMGETGSGKEVIARAIHQASPRSKGSFIPIDCGAIPETLLESELFGHEKGAFTGAETQKIGKFEMAEGGTLFLDEISNMPLGSQAKLLRVLQDKKVYRVGGTKPVTVNVRILAASNQDLHELAVTGSFRSDLYYRLTEFVIMVPPLRERKEDIPYLAKRFLDSANVELKKQVRGFSEAALNVLFNYNWPGNVRQLRSTIRRAALLADDLITEKQMELLRVPVPGLAFTPKVEGEPWKGLSLKEIVQQSSTAVEREVLTRILKVTGGNKAKAARLLKIDYKTIHEKVKKLGIQTEKNNSSEDVED